MSTKTLWSKEEDKAFENAIAKYWVEDDIENSKDEQWEKISSQVPNKDMEELKLHYQMLVDDVLAIEEGNIPLPNYVVEEASSSNKDHNNTNNHGFHGLTGTHKRSTSGLGSGFSSGLANDSSGHGSKGGSKSEQERKKGIPWTEEEHRLFLLGLDKFGKGDWRSISRNFVISRTPTQVASHAQKYFIRLNSMNRDRRRSSIHDITSLNNGDIASSSSNSNNSIRAPPITGQQTNSNNLSNGGAIGGGVPGKQIAHPHHHHMGGLGVYGTPVHHHPHHHHVGPSAVGTPVLLSPPGPHHHPPYVVPIAYPLAPPTMHQ